MYRNILIPLDGSDLAERAVPYAQILARQHGAQLLLVRAVDPSDPPRRAHPQAQHFVLQEAQEYLTRCAAGLTKNGAPEVAVAVHSGAAGPGIVDEIALRGVDLVVMSTHSYGTKRPDP